MIDKAGKRFRKVSILTVVAVYFLILVGGIVRSTGAGMGCPDWPKCFGQWVPPTDVSELPANYQEIYADRGYHSTEFNPVKTWIEYGNRLVGVTIGFLIFLTLIFSLPYRKTDPTVFYISLISFILVGFQGWLGSKVVATNLMPLMISIHMIVALIIAGLLLYAVARSQKGAFSSDRYSSRRAVYLLIWSSIVISLAQIVIGIQVREGIDAVAASLGATRREFWIENLGVAFPIHRSFSLVVALINILLIMKIRVIPDGLLNTFGKWLALGLMLEIASGVAMAYFGIPPYLQPVHLLLSTVMFGLQFLILLKYYYSTTVKTSVVW